jgi:hypothetical protein
MYIVNMSKNGKCEYKCCYSDKPNKCTITAPPDTTLSCDLTPSIIPNYELVPNGEYNRKLALQLSKLVLKTRELVCSGTAEVNCRFTVDKWVYANFPIEVTELIGVIWADAKYPGRRIFSIRETITIPDWIDDALAATTPVVLPPVTKYGGQTVRIHDGFWRFFGQTSLTDSIPNAVQYLATNPEITEIDFTGYSLGAALAQLSAFYMTNILGVNKKHRVYTIGTPRVGDQDFARIYNETIKISFRIANNDDLITQLPPIYLNILGNNYYYAHTKGLISYAANVTNDVDIPPDSTPEQILALIVNAQHDLRFYRAMIKDQPRWYTADSRGSD